MCLSLILMTYVALVAQAQIMTNPMEDADSIAKKRENNIFSARTKITVFVFANRYINGLLFTNPGKNAYYFPIAPLNIGLGFSHKWLAINIAIMSPKIGKKNYNGDGNKYNNFNFQILAYTPRYGLDAIYSQNIGYFLGNFKGYVHLNGTPNQTPYFDMKTNRLTVNLLRVFNPTKYSMNATMIGGERQKRSASSLILNTTFSFNSFNMSDSIPSYVLSQMNQNAIFQGGAFFSIGLLPGYGFIWIIKKNFYLGLIPAFGPSFQYKMMNFEGYSEDRFAVSYRLLAKAGMGFHAKRWTAGLTILFDSEKYHLAESTNIINNNGRITLRVGYKIDVPKWAKGVSKKMTKAQNRVENTVNQLL
jgi:hypothetical protein